MMVTWQAMYYYVRTMSNAKNNLILSIVSVPYCTYHTYVPNCLISDIIQMYSDASACVSMELGPTEWFKTTSGVLQVDTLSLYLLIILLDYALKKTLHDDVGFVVRKLNGSPHPAIYIGILA